jgi:hypothetical protein
MDENSISSDLKVENNFADCYDLCNDKNFAKESTPPLPTPMERLFPELLERLYHHFNSDVISFFKHERGLNLFRNCFWYSFCFMFGNNELREKLNHPRSSYSVFSYEHEKLLKSQLDVLNSKNKQNKEKKSTAVKVSQSRLNILKAKEESQRLSEFGDGVTAKIENLLVYCYSYYSYYYYYHHYYYYYYYHCYYYYYSSLM